MLDGHIHIHEDGDRAALYANLQAAGMDGGVLISPAPAGYQFDRCAAPAEEAYTISINAEKGSVDYHLKGKLRISKPGQETEIHEYIPLHFSRDPLMAKEVIEKCARDEPSPVNLFDMAKILRILDAFYRR